MATIESKFDFEQLTLRLERNHRCVLRLAKNLNSYKYEPKNYECFAKLRELKASFSKLAENQMQLFNQIQHHLITFEAAENAVKKSIHQYQELEKGMAKYLLDL